MAKHDAEQPNSEQERPKVLEINLNGVTRRQLLGLMGLGLGPHAGIPSRAGQVARLVPGAAMSARGGAGQRASRLAVRHVVQPAG